MKERKHERLIDSTRDKRHIPLIVYVNYHRNYIPLTHITVIMSIIYGSPFNYFHTLFHSCAFTFSSLCGILSLFPIFYFHLSNHLTDTLFSFYFNYFFFLRLVLNAVHTGTRLKCLGKI